jgi:hypothetical protein
MNPSATHILLEGIVNHGLPKRMIELIEQSDYEDLEDDKELITFLDCFHEYIKGILENSKTKTSNINA